MDCSTWGATFCLPLVSRVRASRMCPTICFTTIWIRKSGTRLALPSRTLLRREETGRPSLAAPEITPASGSALASAGDRLKAANSDILIAVFFMVSLTVTNTPHEPKRYMVVTPSLR